MKTIFPVLALLSCMAMVVVNGSSGKEKFYIIAHMANNEKVAGWALDTGANALEIDTTFSKDGTPQSAYHGHPCDCWCATYGVCYYKFDICNAERPMTSLLTFIMNHEKINNLALVYLDSKMSKVMPDKYDSAAEQMISLIEEQLFTKGYKGKVLIGGYKTEYLDSIAKYATQSSFATQIFMSQDRTEDHKKSLKYMSKLPYTRRMFSVGLSACTATNYYEETLIGSVNRAKGVISEVIAWTLDRETSFQTYYELGARGIITNDVSSLVQWTKTNGIPLYGPNDKVQEATRGRDSLETKSRNYECNCSYAWRKGCIITSSSPDYTACKCERKWYIHYYWCKADVIGCKNASDPKCASPDTTRESCLLGSGISGNCDGY